MREAGKILSQVHDILAKEVKPGVSTWHIDKVGKEAILDFGCKPSFLGYDGYPAVPVDCPYAFDTSDGRRTVSDNNVFFHCAAPRSS